MWHSVATAIATRHRRPGPSAFAEPHGRPYACEGAGLVCRPAASERAHLPERRGALRERVVLVDRLFRLGLDPYPRRIGHIRVPLQEAIEHRAHDVLDELRIAVGQLDEPSLVRTLEQAVCGRGEGLLDDVDELVRLDVMPRRFLEDERRAVPLVV